MEELELVLKAEWGARAASCPVVICCLTVDLSPLPGHTRWKEKAKLFFVCFVVFVCFIFETGFHSVVLADLELWIIVWAGLLLMQICLLLLLKC